MLMLTVNEKPFIVLRFFIDNCTFGAVTGTGVAMCERNFRKGDRQCVQCSGFSEL